MSTPIINLLKMKVDESRVNNNIIELSPEANNHLNVMYSFTGEITKDIIAARADNIAQWLRDTHPRYIGMNVMIGDVPALVPLLCTKLKKYGFNPMILLNSPSIAAFPTSRQRYDLTDTMVLVES